MGSSPLLGFAIEEKNRLRKVMRTNEPTGHADKKKTIGSAGAEGLRPPGRDRAIMLEQFERGRQGLMNTRNKGKEKL